MSKNLTLSLSLSLSLSLLLTVGLFVGMVFAKDPTIRQSPLDTIQTCGTSEYATLTYQGIECKNKTDTWTNECTTPTDCCSSGEFLKITPTGTDCFPFTNKASTYTTYCADCCWKSEFAVVTTVGLRCAGESCTRDSDCSSPLPYCNTTIGRCVPCTQDSHCSGSNNYCSPTNKCETCSWDTTYTCSNNKRVKYCRLSDGTIKNTQTLSCPLGGTCSNGQCVCTPTTASWGSAPACSSPSSVTCGTTIPNTTASCSYGRTANCTSTSCTGSAPTRTCSGKGTYCSSGTCTNNSCYVAPQQCSSGTVSWTVSGNTCSGTRSTTNSGSSATVSNTTSGKTGSATYSCTGTSWGSATNATCAASNTCTNATKPRNPVVTAGDRTCTASVHPSNSTAGYTYEYRKYRPLPRGSWQSSGSFTNLTNGTNYEFEIRRKNSSGSCQNWAVCPGLTGCTPTTSVTPQCTGGTVSWTVGSHTCSGTRSTTNSGSSATVSNTTSGKTGSATYSCTGTTWGSATNATCAASNTCDYSPVCSPLTESETSDANATCGATRTRIRTTACTGGCGNWGNWSGWLGGTACTGGKTCSNGSCTSSCTNASAPAALTATPGNTQCTIAENDTGTYDYRIKQGTGSWTTASSQTAYSKVYSSLINNQSYTFYMQRRNSSGSCTTWSSSTAVLCTPTASCTPVNGGWSSTVASSVACGTTHTETCTNPTPSCGGSSCSGTAPTVTGTHCSNGSCSGGQCVTNTCKYPGTCNTYEPFCHKSKKCRTCTDDGSCRTYTFGASCSSNSDCCDYSPACSPLTESETSDANATCGATRTRSRTTACTGGCGNWGDWSGWSGGVVCADGQTCSNGSCSVTCKYPGTCNTYEPFCHKSKKCRTCTDDGSCRTYTFGASCSSNSDCQEVGSGCTSHSDCGSSEYCDACTASGSCSGSGSCKSCWWANERCGNDGNLYRACKDNGAKRYKAERTCTYECFNNFFGIGECRVCNISTHAGCSGSKPYCISPGHMCEECLSDSHCGSERFCSSSGRCRPCAWGYWYCNSNNSEAIRHLFCGDRKTKTETRSCSTNQICPKETVFVAPPALHHQEATVYAQHHHLVDYLLLKELSTALVPLVIPDPVPLGVVIVALGHLLVIHALPLEEVDNK